MLAVRRALYSIHTLVFQFGLHMAARFKALPRISIKDLSLEKFDKTFLNKRPVLIEGVTQCPLNFSYANILDVCDGSLQTKVYRMSQYEKNDEDGDDYGPNKYIGMAKGQIRSLESYVKRVQKGSLREALYAFGFDVAHNCPRALETMVIPAHFIGNFEAEWQGRRGECDHVAGPRAFLNTMYFATNLHIDQMHSAFYTSMCEGQKAWRVVTSSEVRKHRKEFDAFLASPGVERKGKLVLADLVDPFDTWTSQSPLEAMNITVYEGIQEPGSLLYLPAGAPHAARALTNQSVMIANNERSLEDLRALHSICSKTPRHELPDFIGKTCFYSEESWSTYPRVRRNMKKFGAHVVREDTPFLKAFGCSREKACALLGDVPAWNKYCYSARRDDL